MSNSGFPNKKNMYSGEVDLEKEVLETLYVNKSSSSTKIERIVSSGQTTPKNKWYDQEEDEFVLLLKGKASILFRNSQGEEKLIELVDGDYLLIPKHQKHLVTETSIPTYWLTVFAK